MAFHDASRSGKRADSGFHPGALGAGAHGGSSFFSGGSRGGDQGGRMGALQSTWISRLRPPPRPPPTSRPLFQPAADLGGHGFFCVRPRPTLALSPRLPPRDATAASRYSSRQMLQEQQRGVESEQENGRGGERGEMTTGFGPFQVGAKSGPFALVQGLKQQHGHPHFPLLEGDKADGSRWSCGQVTGVAPGTGKGNYRSFVADRCVPFFERVAQVGAARGEGRGAAGRDGGDRIVSMEDKTGQPNPVFRQRGMSPNTRVVSEIGRESAAGSSSQMFKDDQWLRRHRRRGDSRLLDYHSSSRAWPLSNGSVAQLQGPQSCVGPRRVVDEASSRRMHNQNVMASAQGAACVDTTDDTATARTSYDIPDSNEVVPQQFVTKSSVWNVQRIEQTRVVSSFYPSSLDKGVGMKRILDQSAFVPSKFQKLRT